MIEDECPKDAENVAHEEPKVSLQWPNIFDQVIKDSDSDTSVDDRPNDEEEPWRGDPEMELVRSNLVFVGAFELVHHDDGDEHDRCKDSYNPLGFPSKTKGIDFLRLGFLNELVVLAVVESL